MEEKKYSIRIVPFVKYTSKGNNGVTYEDVEDNLSSEDINNMSCEPRIFRRKGDLVYLAEIPLAFKGGTGVKGFLCYVFDELTEEEQEKYMDRSEIFETNVETVVQVYGESSKRFFGKRKTKRKNK